MSYRCKGSLVFRWTWILISLLYLAIRFQNTPGVLTDHGVVLNDTDPYYRMHRIETMVKQNLLYPLHDSDLSFPHGFDVPWPLGLDYLLAIPLKLFSVTQKTTIEVFSAIAIPFLSLPTLWAAGAAAWWIGGRMTSIGCGVLMTTLRAHSDASSIGRIDHHFLEAFGVALVLFLGLLSFYQPSKRHDWLLATTLALAPSFWPQAWILSVFLGLACVLSQRIVTRPFLWASVLSLFPLLLSDRFPSGAVSLFGFSWAAPLVYGWTALLFQTISIAEKRTLSARSFAMLCYVGTITAFVMFQNEAGALLSHSKVAFGALSLKHGTLEFTTETFSLFRVLSVQWRLLGGLLFILSFAWMLMQVFRRGHLWLVGFSLGPVLLALIQIRFCAMAAPLLCLGSALFLVETGKVAIRRDAFRYLVVACGFVALVIVNKPTMGLVREENIHPFFRPVRGLSRFLDKQNEGQKSEKKSRALAAHWEYGHWILYDANVPVVAHPFHGSSSLDTLDLFLSSGVSRLSEYLKRYPVRYLVVEAPTGRLLRWFKILGKDPNTYVISKGSYVAPRPAFFDLLLARFFFLHGVDKDGRFPRDWRLVFVSPFASPDHKEMPALKLFEHVKGAVISKRSWAKDLYVLASIQTRDGVFSFRNRGDLDGKGYVTWVVPYGKTQAGGVFFDGRYTIVNARQTVVSHTPVITETDVLEGNTIDVQ